MKRGIILRLRHLAALWVAGTLALGLVTWACFQLGLGVAATGFLFLVVILLLSLFDSLVSSLFFSLIAAGGLDYFFTQPTFSFTVVRTEDIAALIAFGFASIAIAGLAKRRRRDEVHRQQPELLGVHEVEEELRSSERRYRYLFEYMPIAMFQLDPRALAELFRSLREQGVSDLGPYLDRHPDMLYRMMDLIIVENVNDYAVRLFGARDRSELLGPSQSFWKKNPQTFRRAMESRFRGEPSFQQETELATLDGRDIKVLFSAARLAGGTGLSLVGLVDITERAQAQEKLQQLQAEFAHAARLAMLGELTASIAHEVNQPLTALRINGETMLRWLDRAEPDLAQIREKMLRMNADAARAADIITRIRAMAAGRAPQRTPLALDYVITESLLFLRHELHAKGISISLDLAQALPPVTGDRTQLQQVVVNLAMNAAQAMGEAETVQRRLSIRTLATDGRNVSCIVEDSGPGIKSEHLPRLFDSFFTTKGGGMGMGLPISRSIIEAHQGQIRADNGSSLGGARFTFVLPLERSSAG